MYEGVYACMCVCERLTVRRAANPTEERIASHTSTHAHTDLDRESRERERERERERKREKAAKRE